MVHGEMRIYIESQNKGIKFSLIKEQASAFKQLNLFWNFSRSQLAKQYTEKKY